MAWVLRMCAMLRAMCSNMQTSKVTEQLTAKRQVVLEHLEIVQAHFDSLIVKENLLDEHCERVCNFVCSKFDVLKHALERKKKELISNILDDTSHVKKDLDSAKRSAELVIGKSLQVGRVQQ